MHKNFQIALKVLKNWEFIIERSYSLKKEKSYLLSKIQ